MAETRMMDQGAKNRRRYPRLFRNVRFLFYFLGQTREVYTVDISYNGAFIQTDVFPPLGSFVILEHYHLKKRNVTLGLVGKIRRIQTPFQSSPSVRGVGVEWVRCYCNQGFLPLKQFLERDLGYQPFDWDTHLTYEEYDRKIVYDFATGRLSPSPEELEAILGNRRRTVRAEADAATPVRRAEESLADEAVDEVSRRPTRPVMAGTVPGAAAELRPGFAEDTWPPVAAIRPAGAARPSAMPLAEALAEPPDEAPQPPAPRRSAEPTHEVLATPPPRAPSADEQPTPPAGARPVPPLPASAPPSADDLLPVEIKVVFGIGNRMFYGVVRGLSEREVRVETAALQGTKVGARLQVRLPLSARNYRYMVVIYGRVTEVDEQEGANRSFRLQIESLDEFQNPGGFRFFLQTLAR